MWPPVAELELGLLQNSHTMTLGDCPWGGSGGCGLHTGVKSVSNLSKSAAKGGWEVPEELKGTRKPNGHTVLSPDWLCNHTHAQRWQIDLPREGRKDRGIVRGGPAFNRLRRTAKSCQETG